MSKEKNIFMVNEYTQTEDLNTTASFKDSHRSASISDESVEDKKVVQVENVHDKAYDYLESLEKKYSQELDNLYEKAGSLMDIFREAPNFDIGLKKAIEQYKIIKGEDKENFILIQFLEDFYGRYAIFDNYHTPEVHENDFKSALSLAYAIDHQELLGEIYNISE